MILVRHGQTPWNLHFGATRVDPGLPDPGLTELGRAQARASAERLATEDIALIVASPYRRTLETADIIEARLGVPVTIEAMVRERAGYSCDEGTLCSELGARWPRYDFSGLPDRWWPDLGEPEDLLHRRCRDFSARMAIRPDWHRVVVVTHWGVIRALTGMKVGNGEHVRFDPTAEPAA